MLDIASSIYNYSTRTIPSSSPHSRNSDFADKHVRSLSRSCPDASVLPLTNATSSRGDIDKSLKSEYPFYATTNRDGRINDFQNMAQSYLQRARLSTHEQAEGLSSKSVRTSEPLHSSELRRGQGIAGQSRQGHPFHHRTAGFRHLQTMKLKNSAMTALKLRLEPPTN